MHKAVQHQSHAQKYDQFQLVVYTPISFGFFICIFPHAFHDFFLIFVCLFLQVGNYEDCTVTNFSILGILGKKPQSCVKGKQILIFSGFHPSAQRSDYVVKG